MTEPATPAPWQRGEQGYSRVAWRPFTAGMTASLVANPAFQDQPALDQEGHATAEQEAAPTTYAVSQAISFALLKAYERRHHAELRGVGLDERLSRLQALIDGVADATSESERAPLAAEFTALVEDALFAPYVPVGGSEGRMTATKVLEAIKADAPVVAASSVSEFAEPDDDCGCMSKPHVPTASGDAIGPEV